MRTALITASGAGIWSWAPSSTEWLRATRRRSLSRRSRAESYQSRVPPGHQEERSRWRPRVRTNGMPRAFERLRLLRYEDTKAEADWGQSGQPGPNRTTAGHEGSTRWQPALTVP